MARLILTTRRGQRVLSPPDLEAALGAALQEGDSFWVDAQEPGADQVAILERVLGLQPVAVAEVRRPSQLPRVEVYPGHAVLVVHAVEVDRESRIPVHRVEVDCILGPRFLVTVHVREGTAVDEMHRRLEGGAPFPATPDLLLAGVIDLLVKQLYHGLDYLADSVAVLAGIYGMNFGYMPELGWKYGYPVTLLLMVIAGYGMYRWFRARGWFGEP